MAIGDARTTFSLRLKQKFEIYVKYATENKPVYVRVIPLIKICLSQIVVVKKSIFHDISEFLSLRALA